MGTVGGHLAPALTPTVSELTWCQHLHEEAISTEHTEPNLGPRLPRAHLSLCERELGTWKHWEKQKLADVCHVILGN